MVEQGFNRSSRFKGRIAKSILLAFFISSGFGTNCGFSEALPERVLLKNNWEYFIPDLGLKSEAPGKLSDGVPSGPWKSIEKPCFNQKGKNPESVWFRVRLPATSSENQSIYIRSMEKPFRAFFQGSEIYSSQCGTQYNFCGFNWHLFDLPRFQNGEFLYFLTKNPPAGPIGLCFETYIGNSESQIYHLVGDNLSTGIIAILGLFCAISAVIVAGVMKLYKPFLAFAGYAGALGLWLFSASRGPAVRQFLVESPLFWWHCCQFGLYSAPAFLILFYRQSFEDRKTITFKALLPLLVVHSIYLVVMLLEWVGIVPTYASYNSFIYLCYLFPVLLLLDSLAALRVGGRSAKIFALGFVFLNLFFLHGLLVSKRIIKGWSGYQLQYGLAFSVLCTFTVVIIKLKERLDSEEQIKIENAKLQAFTLAITSYAHDVLKPLDQSAALTKVLLQKAEGTPFYGILEKFADRNSKQIRFARGLSEDVLQFGTDKRSEYKPTQLHEAIEAAILNYHDTVNAVEVSIEQSVNHKSWVLADSKLLGRAIFNLLTNARKAIEALATDPGKQRIYIETSDLVIGKQPFVRIIVGNAGTFIEENIQRRLFKEVFRGDSGVGTGVGLIIVHKIVSGHGGRIFCTSNKDRMTTEFVIELPAFEHQIELNIESNLVIFEGGSA